MKTSHILLATIVVVTLTGMVATNVLLKQEYAKIDWRDPYQTFERRTIPAARHVVIDAAPVAEVVVEKSASPQALLLPSMASSYRTRQQGDTLFISFTMNYDGDSRNPRDTRAYALPAGLVLRLPNPQSLRINNGRLSVHNIVTDRLTISLQNSRLRTDGLAINGPTTVTASRNSFAVLGTDRYQLLRAVVADSSGIELDNSQIDVFEPDVSPKAEVQLRGRAVRWLSRKSAPDKT